MKALKSTTVFICVLLAFVGAIFFIRCYWHVPSGDELLYEYVWESDDPTDLWEPGHRYERKVSDIGDIWQTQARHYVQVNGRSLVHATEQAFTGHHMLFCVVNTIVFLLFVTLIVRYVATPVWRRSPFLWLIVPVTLLVLFPYQQSLWTSVNYGLNYLWPATMAVGMLILWEQICAGTVSVRWAPLIVLYSLIFGWTHEAFVVGVAGGMFIYYCFNFKRYRGMSIVLTVPLWLSAAVMVFAPGNISRFGAINPNGASLHGIMLRLCNGLDNQLSLKMIWVLVLACVLLLVLGNRGAIRQFVRENSRMISVFAIGTMFPMVANTGAYSHTFAELMAFLLVLKYICATNWVGKPVLKYIVMIICVLFVPWQIIVAHDTVTNYRVQADLVSEYMSSPDGVVRYREPGISRFSRDYIRLWDNEGLSQFYVNVYNNVFFGGNKPWQMLDSADYQAVESPESYFVAANKYPGSAPLYQAPGSRYIWINADEMQAGDSLVANYKRVDWNHRGDVFVRLKFVLMPDSYPSTGEVEIDTLHTRFGDRYRVNMPPVRQITSVDIVR